MLWCVDAGMCVQEEDGADGVHGVARFATRSFEDEFGSTIEGDIQLLQIAIVGILLYTYAAISNCRDNRVGSRFVLTVGGALSRRTQRRRR